MNVKKPSQLSSLLYFLLLLTNVQAQDANDKPQIVDLTNPEANLSEGLLPPPRPEAEPFPAWRDLRPREYTSMLFALSAAATVIPDLSESDKAIIGAAWSDTRLARDKALAYFADSCREVLAGRSAASSDALAAGKVFTLMDQYEEKGTEAHFAQIVDALSEEGAAALVALKDDMHRQNLTANYMDWGKYAEMRPEEALSSLNRSCQNNGTPSQF
ncbi:MAG: hypothetical protein RQ899_09770 [Pseudomonadales bacterium]|nr:hypothetical protein [Pseudomonadales bacterium]